MSELQAPQIAPAPSPAREGCLFTLGWLLAGAVLPLGSLTFYRRAARRSVGTAIGFFFVFTLVITLLTIAVLGKGLSTAYDGIREAYETEAVPVITIRNGIASVDGPQPFYFVDQPGRASDSALVAIDTTGKLREIDEDRYQQGLLLTRSQLHALSAEGEYEVIDLKDINLMLDRDPLVIDSDSVSRAWGVMSAVLIALGLLGLFFWNTVVRLMIIALIALFFWGLVSLMRQRTDFGPILVAGLYAIVPAIYITHAFSRSEVYVPGIQTATLVVFWIIGLVAEFVPIQGLPEGQPVRLWTALLGVPMLTLIILDLFLPIEGRAGPIAIWSVTLGTFIILVLVRLYFRFRDRPSSPMA